MKSDVLGHRRVGSGPHGVLVLNDWMCDTSTWDGARPYLDEERFTWVFADLRGYGRSRGRSGAFTAREAATDVIALADALAWPSFSLVGHSMSALVVLHVAQRHAARVRRVVVVTPPPPAGFGADATALAETQALARAGDAARARALAPRFGDRLSRGWAAHKVARWSATADAEAVAGYAALFLTDGLEDHQTPITAPVLAVTGDLDMPAMRRDAVLHDLAPLCPHLEIAALADVGHYPMQEMPPRTVALLERFLGAVSP